VLFVLAATAVYPLREYVAQQGRIEQLRAKQAALQAANQRLERERARLRDPAYVDQLAKQEFQLAEPGEKPWLLTGTPPTATASGDACTAASRPGTRGTRVTARCGRGGAGRGAGAQMGFQPDDPPDRAGKCVC